MGLNRPDLNRLLKGENFMENTATGPEEMEEIISQFLALPTTAISDGLEGLNHFDPAIRPLKEEYKIAGRAFTVKLPGGDNPVLLKALRQAQPGDILVVDAKADLSRAVAGDFVVGLMQTLGLGGLVVDGAVRDLLALRQLNFPIFCRGTTVAASAKSGSGELNVPISCGGVAVTPGDIITGDVDGIVVVPRSREQAVLSKTLAKLEKDRLRAEKVSGNLEAIRKYLDELP
jgi:regulator of RNase E activity RraA